jgi:hypothetical protein
MSIRCQSQGASTSSTRSHVIRQIVTVRSWPVLAALPSRFAKPTMREVESLLSDAPLHIRVDGLESRKSYAET